MQPHPVHGLHIDMQFAYCCDSASLVNKVTSLAQIISHPLIPLLSATHHGSQVTRRQFISVACAAGISAGFGTPLGGVLWSYEQMSRLVVEM